MKMTSLLSKFVGILLVLKCYLCGCQLQSLLQNNEERCICPGDTIMFECTVIGSSATIWTGSAFQCLAKGIILRHSTFSRGASGDCNDGAIVATSIGVADNNYTSQLSVTVSQDMNNRTVECVRHSNPVHTVGSSTIVLATGLLEYAVILILHHKSQLLIIL